MAPKSTERERERTVRVSRLIGTALTTLTLSAAAVDAAAAATPFTAGSGARPSVAVGPDGSGHVVWEAGGADAKVGYCRIAPGESSCNRAELLDFGTAGNASAAGRAQAFVSASNEVVVTAGCHQCPSGDTGNKTFRWTSVGDGAFGSALQIGAGPAVNGFGTLLFGLGQTYVGTSASRVKAASPSGGDGVQFATGGLFSFGSEVDSVPLPGTVRLVAVANDLTVVKYGVYDAAGPHTATTINNPVNWDVDKTLEAPELDNSQTALNSGPNGLFLTYLSDVGTDLRVGMRRFDSVANVFGSPSYIEGGDPLDDSIQEPDSFQDPAGRIHVVWDSRSKDGRLRYTVSGTDGGGFSAVANLAGGERFTEPEVAAGADGRGFAVWTGSAGAVRVVPLDPQSEPAGSSPSGSGGSSGPGGSSGGATGSRPDTTTPTVKGATIGSRALRPGQGTDFRFTSSEAGQAVLTIEKRFSGLKANGKPKAGKAANKPCRPRTRKRLRALRRQADSPRAYRKLLRKRSCRGWRKVGEIRQWVRPGVNTIAFDGRVAGRKLGRGAYRARLVVTDSAGHASRTETLSFRVVGK